MDLHSNSAPLTDPAENQHRKKKIIFKEEKGQKEGEPNSAPIHGKKDVLLVATQHDLNPCQQQHTAKTLCSLAELA